MLDFGEEITLESFRLPWLIWIQLLVFLLLLVLLYCFSIVALDPSHTTAPPASSDSHLQQLSNHHSSRVTNRLQSNRGVENLSIKGEIAAIGSTGTVREEIAEGEASTSSLYFLHPCYYFKLAREAFLKCLGLDSTSESDGHEMKRKHRKKKES